MFFPMIQAAMSWLHWEDLCWGFGEVWPSLSARSLSSQWNDLPNMGTETRETKSTELRRRGAGEDVGRPDLYPPLPNCFHRGTECRSWAAAHSGRARSIHPEPLDGMAFSSPSGTCGPLTLFTLVFIVGVYTVEGLLRALCLLEFVIFGSL